MLMVRLYIYLLYIYYIFIIYSLSKHHEMKEIYREALTFAK